MASAKNEASLHQHDLQGMPSRYRTNLIHCLSGFKSACLIGTQNTKGRTNLAVFSSIFHVGANPPLLGMVSRPHTVRRDTLENIRATGHYTINLIHRDIIAGAHQTSAKYDADTSEFEAAGLTPQHSSVIQAPYVAESWVKTGLTVREIIPVKSNGTWIIIGEIREILCPQEAIDEAGYIDLNSLGSVTVSDLYRYYLPHLLTQCEYATP